MKGLLVLQMVLRGAAVGLVPAAFSGGGLHLFIWAATSAVLSLVIGLKMEEVEIKKGLADFELNSAKMYEELKKLEQSAKLYNSYPPSAGSLISMRRINDPRYAAIREGIDRYRRLDTRIGGEWIQGTHDSLLEYNLQQLKKDYHASTHVADHKSSSCKCSLCTFFPTITT